MSSICSEVTARVEQSFPTITPPIKNVIVGDVTDAEQRRDNLPEQVGVFRIKSANQRMKDAGSVADDKPLWREHWYEHELCVLFGLTGAGKSILAVQICVEVARNYPEEKVLYFDLELSDKQFERRNKNLETGEVRVFPPNLFCVGLAPDISEDDYEHFETRVLENIESTAEAYGANIIVIDNITFLCTTLEKGDSAGRFITRLKQVKTEHNWSMLILGHTPKDIARTPHQITKTDLFGSSKITAFLDSAFAVGTSSQGSDIRYVVQVKVRADKEKFGSDNVITFRMEKRNTHVEFIELGCCPESEHLPQVMRADQKSELKGRVVELHSQGMSIRQIESQLGGVVKKSAISDYIRQAKEVSEVSMVSTDNVGRTTEEDELPF